MKIIQHINQHIPVWSVLCGDHAIKKQVELINPTLLTKPDFLDPLQNRLRWEIFVNRRGWIAERLCEGMGSFALAQFSISELKDFRTVFSGDYQHFPKYVEKYQENIKFSKYKIKHCSSFYTKDLQKTEEEVKHQAKLTLNLANKSKTEIYNLDLKITNPKYSNDNIFIAANRALLMKKHDEKIYIVDGTHRLTAVLLAKQNSKNLFKDGKLPFDSIYAFYWVDTRRA